MIEAHDKAVLHFSGGKDSLACLYLLRPYWDRLTVMWCNTGDAFPETHRQMERISAMVPHFVEVAGDLPNQQEECGPPADLLPVWNSVYGRAVDEGHSPFRVQDPLSCCSANIWQPVAEATKLLGFTLVIRGQRSAESRKGLIRSGHVEAGVRYWFPIEDWTSTDVMAYLKEEGVELPLHYQYVDSSLDCQMCTAYLNENRGKFAYIREQHPVLHARLRERFAYIMNAVNAESAHMLAVMEEF